MLNSLSLSKNEIISIKATDIFSLIKEKVITEVFGFKNLDDNFNQLDYSENINIISLLKDLNNITDTKLSQLEKATKKDLNSLQTERLDLSSNAKVPSTSHLSNMSIESGPSGCAKIVNFRTCIEVSDFKKKPRRVDKKSKNSENLGRKRKLLPFNVSQMCYLFKGILFNDELPENCKEKLQNCYYSEHFFNCIYNKNNNLTKFLASKRRKLCLKLLNIFKIIVLFSSKC